MQYVNGRGVGRSSSSPLWRPRDGIQDRGWMEESLCISGVSGGVVEIRGLAACGVRRVGRDGWSKRELVRVKDELCWYKSAQFWQFAATATAYGQEVDFDLRVDHVGRLLQWRQPITSSAQFVCHIYTEFMARSHLSFVSAIVCRKSTHSCPLIHIHTYTHTLPHECAIHPQ